MQRFLLLLLFQCLSLVVANAQNEQTTAPDELLEYFFQNNEQATEADGQVFLEQLDYLSRNKLDLNTATFDELTSSQLIRPELAQNLINYRNTLGTLISIHELQAVPAWELDDIKRILPFAELGSLDARANNGSIWSVFKASKKDLLFRYTPAPASLPNNTEGSGHGLSVRFRATAQGKLRFGILGEKDPGEAFFRGSNKTGFDNYTAYLFLKNSADKRIKNLALGNYQVRLGQGLIMYSGLAFGKSPSSTLVLRSADALGPFTSLAEGLAMRGAAATIRSGKHIETTVFGSYARRDANLNLATDTLLGGAEEIFTALQTSGLHRTASELENEKVLNETAVGASVRWSDNQTDIAAQSVFYRFDKPWQPTPSPYRAFAFTGKQLLAGSVSYRTLYRNIIPFGETAVSDNGAVATTNGVILSPDRKASLAVVHRHLPARYQNINGNPFADGSSGNNEHGLFIGLEVRPLKGWTINTYADVWRNPWLRYNADLPTPGHDILIRLTYVKKRSFSAYAQLQRKNRVQNTPSTFENAPALLAAERISFRLHAEQNVTPGLILRSRLEHSWFQYAGFAQTKGFLAYTEAVMKRSLNVPFSFSARYAIFDIANSQNAIYAYEQDVTAAFSVPQSSGRGSRAYLNLRWFISRGMTLEGRVARTFLDKTATDSQELGSAWFYRAQLRFDW
jgi:Helix-hairpin-helix motif